MTKPKTHYAPNRPHAHSLCGYAGWKPTIVADGATCLLCRGQRDKDLPEQVSEYDRGLAHAARRAREMAAEHEAACLKTHDEGADDCGCSDCIRAEGARDALVALAGELEGGAT